MTENIRCHDGLRHVPVKAELLRRLLEFVGTGRSIDLWMTFPQENCCFAFGPSKGPVPIRALFLLWSGGWPYLQESPECGGSAYMVAFGSLLSVGGGQMICPACAARWHCQLGSLPTVGHEYIAKSPLVGTEFFPTGMLFGGAYVSDGKRLCEFLGVTEIPEVGPGVSMRVEGQDLRVELETEAVPEEDGNWLFRRRQGE